MIAVAFIAGLGTLGLIALAGMSALGEEGCRGTVRIG